MLYPLGSPLFTAWNSIGQPLSGGKLYCYEAGTTTAKATYADASGNSANPQPVALNARGEAPVFYSGAAKFVLKDASDVEIWSADYVGGNGVAEVSSMDGLRALGVPAGLVSINLLGYYAPGDGGGGQFFWDANSTAADNGGTVITPTGYTGSGRWARALPHGAPVTPAMFGAKGDYDGATGTDDTSAFSQMFAWAVSKLQHVDLGDGKAYLVNPPFTLNFSGTAGIHIIGRGVTLYGNSGAGGDYLINILGRGNAYSDLLRGVVVDGIRFTGKTGGACSGVKIVNALGAVVRNVFFDILSGGLYAEYNADLKVLNSDANGVSVAFKTYHCRDSKFTDCHAYSGDYGFIFEGTYDVAWDGGLVVTGCTANSNTQKNFWFLGQYTPIAQGLVAEEAINNLVVEGTQFGEFTNLWFGSSTGRSIHMLKSGTLPSPDYNTFRTINAQSELSFNSGLGLAVADVTMYECGYSASGGALYIGGCNYYTLSDVRIRQTKVANDILLENSDGILDSIGLEGPSSVTSIHINGGKVRGKSISLSGAILSPSIATPATDTGAVKLDIYRDVSGKLVREVTQELLLSSSVAFNSSGTYDVATWLSNTNTASSALLRVDAGSTGSYFSVLVRALRSIDAFDLDLINDPGSIGGRQVTVSGSVITLTNSSGTTDSLFNIYAIDRVQY